MARGDSQRVTRSHGYSRQATEASKVIRSLAKPEGRLSQFTRTTPNLGRPTPLFTTLRAADSPSSRGLPRTWVDPPHYLRHFARPTRPVHEDYSELGSTPPTIYDTSRGRLAQFTRTTPNLGRPTTLFTTLREHRSRQYRGFGAPAARIARVSTIRHGKQPFGTRRLAKTHPPSRVSTASH